MRQRILCALSGGVDSSVAAALLVRAGYEVIGVTMKLWRGEDDPGAFQRLGGCCTVGDAEDARRVAARLDIPYYVLNLQPEFEAAVVRPFIDEYTRGRTPNPCARCNEFIKFRAFMERAADLECDAVATGHYARCEWQGGRYRLRRGADARKDQSYVLGMLRQEELARCHFPVGTLSKGETRTLAGELGLDVAAKPDSQEICFVTHGDHARFVREHAPEATRPGLIVDESGSVLGEHRGLCHYTVGQRKGLGLAAAEPWFVLRLEAESNRIVVGKRGDLRAQSLEASRVTWTWRPPPAGTTLQAQTRAHALTRTCRLEQVREGAFTVSFPADENAGELTPGGAIAPGQLCVLYDDDEVVGSGTIERVD